MSEQQEFGVPRSIPMPGSKTLVLAKHTNFRWVMGGFLFLITTINFADRATLSVVGTLIQKELGMSSLVMGYVFSAFAWAYVVGQVPGGWLLDKLGSRKTYFLSLALWSFFTVMQAFIGFAGSAAVAVLFILRFIVGLAESPAFPANSRVAAAWFPTHERGKVTAAFTSSVYFSSVIFLPVMAWLTQVFNWHCVFIVMGGLGMVVAPIWYKLAHAPKDSPYADEGEVRYIQEGGGLVDMDQMAANTEQQVKPWTCIKELLSNRMMLGVYIGQYCITTLTYFFLTWFPIYLVQARGMTILKAGLVASIPALAGFIGGLLGGAISDLLLKRGLSLTLARKTPLVVGMLLSMIMVLCNYTEVHWLVIALMGVAFFGKGMGAMGWVVVSDTSPKQAIGLSGGLFNSFGNVAGITTPIIIGYIVDKSGSFNGALIFVAANAALALGCYLFLVGTIKRIELPTHVFISRPLQPDVLSRSNKQASSKEINI